MKEFKSLMHYDSALKIMLGKVEVFSAAVGPVDSAKGRILGGDVVSKIDSPPFDRSAMDGYALIAEDTFNASENAPKELEIIDDIIAGEVSGMTLGKGQTIGVTTGASIPVGADAVIMQEFTSRDGNKISVFKNVPPGKNISLKGEDIRKGQLALKTGKILTPQDQALLRALGHEDVPLRDRPKVSIIVTGDEFTDDVGGPSNVGKIKETNSIMLEGLLKDAYCEVARKYVVPDDDKSIISALKDANEISDILICTGGSSFGRKDMLPQILDDFLFHGVSIKPGKPFGFSLIGNKPVFIFSGYPVAAFVQFHVFLIPYLEKALNTSMLKKVKLPFSGNVSSSLGRREFVRCYVEDGHVRPLRVSGSGLLSSLTNSTGFVMVNEESEGLNDGELCEFTYYL